MATTRIPRRRGRRKSDGPNPTDVHVGSRVRLRRNMMGLSQGKLGEALGLSFQQVQKYERGINRIGASRLYELSSVLGVGVSYFFAEMPEEVASCALPGAPSPVASEGEESDPMMTRETLELARNYHGITDPST